MSSATVTKPSKSRIPLPVNVLKKKEENTNKLYKASQNKSVKINKSVQSLKSFKTKATTSQLVSQVKQLRISENNKSNQRKNLTSKRGCFPAEINSKQIKLKNLPEIVVKDYDGESEKSCLSDTKEKENKLPSKPKHLLAQKGIKFEADEKYRKMLLSERPISPSIFRYGQKLSFSCDRPSIYKKLHMPDDPLKALLDACSSIKRDKKTRPAMQVSANVLQSPMQVRFPLYGPGIDPKEEVLRSLTAMKEKKKLKNMVKSTKKVSFNLEIEKFSPQDNWNETPPKPEVSLSVRVCHESHLTNICEQNEENTPNTPSNENQDHHVIYLKHDKIQEEESPAKIFTPRPISFTESKYNEFSSPEFINSRDKKLLKESAPISTPLVLKSLAHSVLSPEQDFVQLKLNFTEEEKGSPQKEANSKLLPLGRIVTYQKMLDDLADKECNLCLSDESIPVICGRYLQNPVALTLTEGDEMHFLPINL